MRVCVVGNGPLAKGHGAEIDACDFVVRCTGWWQNGCGDVGQKLDAYAWFGSEIQSHIPAEYAAVSFQHWYTLPISRCNPPHPHHCGIWPTVVATAALRPIRWITEELWQREAAHLMVASRWYASDVPPSTGFTAIDLAIHLLAPDEILLYGFDGTFADKTGWGDSNPEWHDSGPHDLYAEKRLIHQLAVDGIWLGEPCPTKILWPDNPILREGL